MQLHFVNPWALYVLWTVPVVGFAWMTNLRRAERKLDRMLSPAMRTKLCPSSAPSRFRWQLAMLIVGLLLAIVAAARPQWGVREERVMQRGRDLVIALDVSRSMLARDVRPSRLLRAKADIMDLLRELRGDRVALVVFRNKAIQICPLTIDYSFVEQALDDVTIDSAPPGATDIGDGIAKALDAFESDDAAHKAIILISDGEDLTERAKAAADQARVRKIPVFTVGLGDPAGAPIPDPAGGNLTHQGREVITRLEHDAMKEIAEISGGAYVPVGTANVKLGELYRDHLSRIAARDIEELSRERHVDRYQWFLLPALLLFLATAFLSRGQPATGRRKPGTPAPRKEATGPGARAIVTTILVISMVAGSRAEEGMESNQADILEAPATNAVPSVTLVPQGRDGARIAQRLFQKGEYKLAAEAYMQAARSGSIQLQNTLIFNAGCALYEAGEYDAAVKQFQTLLLREDADFARASYNLGCSLHQLARALAESGESAYSKEQLSFLEKSGKAFQDAVLLDSGNSDAEINLSMTANILPGIRERVKIQDLMSRYGDIPPFQMAEEMLKNQRVINEDVMRAMTNPAPSRIQELEELSARQGGNADLLIPLKPALMSVAGADPSNTAAAQQIAMLDQHIEAIRNVMHQASEQLRDLDGAAASSAATSEAGIYRIWKGMAPHGPLLSEDIRRQSAALSLTTNTIEQADRDTLKRIQVEQDEAVELTDLFITRFSEAPSCAAAPEDDQVPDQTTEQDGGQISKETREKILELATQASTAQKQASDLLQLSKVAESVDAQQKSLDFLREIQELLPKDKDKQDQQQQDQDKDQQDQDKNQQEDKDQQQQQQQDQQEDKEDGESEEQESPEQQPPEPEQEESEQEKAEPEQAEKDEMTPEQARDLLERAMQRERDHKKEKMQRNHIPPSPSDKDW